MVKKSTVNRPRCFFDVTSDGTALGRVIFELFSDVVPLTSENFRALCTGERGKSAVSGKNLHYKGSLFHRIVKNFMIQGGDFTAANGTGGESIYGGLFDDENLSSMKHDSPYLLSMANRGRDTNGSQFFITTRAAPHLDGLHVVFGRVIAGHETVNAMESERIGDEASSRPAADVVINNCGELVMKKKAPDVDDDSAGEDVEIDDDRTDDAIDGEHSAIKADEVPDIPSNRFLHRRSTTPDEVREKRRAEGQPDRPARRREDRRPTERRTASGKKIKGRGSIRCQSPPSERRRSGYGSRRERSRSPDRNARARTPPHWKKEQNKLKTYTQLQDELHRKADREERKRQGLPPDDVDARNTLDERRKDRHGGRKADASPARSPTQGDGSPKSSRASPEETSPRGGSDGDSPQRSPEAADKRRKVHISPE